MKEIKITDIRPFKIGQKEDGSGRTGCTVLLHEEGAVGGVSVRGGAPGTRETDLLKPENLVHHIHGVFLSGGSAFGLDVGSGVMKFLEENGIGFDAQVARVPIVPGAILFDLSEDPAVGRPDAALGYEAARSAYGKPAFRTGNYGAGAGASVGKALGKAHSMKGGIGSWACRIGEVEIGAVIAVNSFGDVIDPATGQVVAGLYEGDEFLHTEKQLFNQMEAADTNRFQGNTTIGTVITNAAVTKAEANKIADAAHDGLARTIRPSHTFVDGDTIFCMSDNQIPCDTNALAAAAALCVEKAVLHAVLASESTKEYPSAKDFHMKG